MEEVLEELLEAVLEMGFFALGFKLPRTRFNAAPVCCGCACSTVFAVYRILPPTYSRVYPRRLRDGIWWCAD